MRAPAPPPRPGSRLRLIVAIVAIVATISSCTSARNLQNTQGTRIDGGTLTFAIALDALPSGLFQTLARNNPWIENVFQPLVRLDQETRAVQPVLATSVTVSPDGRQATITLREGVTFHTGRTLTADDVKFTFETTATPKAGSNLGYVPRAFSSIAVDSPTQLTVTMAQPLGDALFDYLNQTPIVDPQTYSGVADGTQLVGTGPFRFAEWQPGAGFTLERYDGYWNREAVQLERIEYVVTSDATALLSALRSGRAQLAWGLTPSDARPYFGDQRYRIIDAGGTVFPLGLNTTTAPLDDKRVRQAIGYALDRQRIRDQVFGGTGEVSSLPWLLGTPGVPQAQVDHFGYDPDRARAMIAEAGATGARIPITYGANPTVRAIFEIVANNLRAAGLDPVGVAVDQPTFQSGQNDGELGAAFLSLHSQVVLSPVTMIDSIPVLRDGNPSKADDSEFEARKAALRTAAATGQGASEALVRLGDYLLDQAFLHPLVQAPEILVTSIKSGDVSTTMRGVVLLENAYVTG
ncbi:ABC transporter substrate-binding protein [Saccharomonospora sp. NPDC046836]|uniref:ABC transporter substrate-binding protein n=1 Tax=Saccharomonospora sp. NPDC046836 TaxID=3156921 RepID=UPI0033D9996D